MKYFFLSVLTLFSVASTARADDPTVTEMLSVAGVIGGDIAAIETALNRALPNVTQRIVFQDNAALAEFDDASFSRQIFENDKGTASATTACTQFGGDGMAYLQDPSNQEEANDFGNITWFGFAGFAAQATVLDCAMLFYGDADYVYPDINRAIADLRSRPGIIRYEGNQLPMRNVDRNRYSLTVIYDGTESCDMIKHAKLVISPGRVLFTFRAVQSAAYLS